MSGENNKIVTGWLASGPLVVILAVSPAFAQGSNSPVQNNNSLVLDEIIVTAQKREQSLSDVPISISAIGGEKIQSSGINNLSELSDFVPGVDISRGPVNTSINIRGIGSGINRSFEQSVGMYIDGIYMGRGRQYRSPFLDIERVEILRGPQGILFGKNTIAGAINITTKSPEVDGDIEGFARVKYQPDDKTREFSGAVSLPLGQNFAIRIAGKISKADGYIHNVPTNSPAIQPDDKTFRVTLVGDILEKLDMNLKYSHSSFKTSGTALTPRFFARSQFANGVSPGLSPLAFQFVNILAPNIAKRGPYDSYIDAFSGLGTLTGPEGTNTKTDNVSLKLNYNLENGVVLTSVTGYSRFGAIDSQDVDFLPIRLLTRYDDRRFKQWSQELRIVSPGGEKIDYIAGIYAEKQNLNIGGQIALDSSFGGMTQLIGLGSVFAAPSFLGPLWNVFPFVEISRNGSYSIETKTYAVFGEMTYNATDYIHISLGGRFTNEKKDVNKSLTLGSNITGGLGVASNNPVLAALWMGGFGTSAHKIKGRSSNSKFDPSVKIQWDASENTMFYVSYSQGFKSGGFNSSDDLNVNNLDSNGKVIGFEYRPEKAKSIEFGLKSDLSDGRAHLDIAVFQTWYTDLQVSTFQGVTFSVSNAAGAKIKGVEANFRWKATEALTFSTAVAYLDFAFTDYTTAGCTAPQLANWTSANVCTQDLTGRRNAFAPKWSGSLQANYFKGLSDNLALNVDLDINFKSQMYTDYDLDENTKQDGYAKINMRIAIENIDGNWWVAAFGHNLTDKVTYSYSVDTPLVSGSYSAVINQGRVFGFEAGFRF